MFSPHGIIAAKELALMIRAVELMLIVIVPVFIMLFFFAWHFRAGNKKATYSPNWEHAKMDELIWWAIPFEIVLVLGALTWSSTHELDPYKPIDSAVTPITIQVVALPWKWLFIYPNQQVASVNELHFPVNTPVNFEITADAPMNSFWIPQLGGQIYAMTGMSTQLHLLADTVGKYPGSSANYSGEGFAQMKFTAIVTSEEDFDEWIRESKKSPVYLTRYTYDQLRQPGSTNKTETYSSVENNLYNNILMQFNSPMSGAHSH